MRRNLIATLIALGATAIVLAAGALGGDTVARLPNFVFDHFQRLAPRVVAKPAALVVDIDEKSLAALGQWPWPRTRLATLVDTLTRDGAVAIGLDILLAEPDRTSPAQLAPLLEAGGVAPSAVARILSGVPDHDAALARSVAAASAIVGVALDGEQGDSALAPKAGFAVVGQAPFRRVPRFNHVLSAVPVILAAARGVGALNIVPDRDGIVRRVPLLVRLDDRPVPSLAAEMFRVARGVTTYVARSNDADGTLGAAAFGGLGALKIGAIEVPTRDDGTLWLHYAPAESIERISAADMLAGKIDPNRIRGRMVVIGSTALGLKDYMPTPLGQAMAGPEIQVQALQQIIDGTYLERPDWLRGAEIAVLAALAVIVALISTNLGLAWSAPTGAAAISGIVMLSWIAFRDHRLLVDPVAPVAALLLTLSGASLMRRIEAEHAQSRLREAFSRYLSPILVEELVAHPERLSLGGEMRRVTVMFCDIRGFAGVAEGLDPQELTALLNRFLSPMSEIVLESRGTIDKYIGDCIMAFWNAPLDDPEHERHAFAAALAMQQRLDRLNRELEAEAQARGQPFRPLRTAVGINSGTCCVGNMGSQYRFDYSILGDAVNVAARLTELAAERDIDLLIGENTANALVGEPLTAIDAVPIRGRAHVERVYTVAPIAARREIALG